MCIFAAFWLVNAKNISRNKHSKIKQHIKFMIKKIAVAVLAILTGATAFAGGLLTNTNQSVHFLRNPARNASTEIDAVYTNPAGLTFLSDGFHLSLTNQSAFQTRTITSTFEGFKYALGNNGSTTKIFKGEASAPVIPSFQLAYKRDKWVFSTSFAITGGGGKATFNHGLPSFESQIAKTPISLNASGVPTTGYSVQSYMEGQQFIFGWQINSSYKINDHLSAALGVRLNIVNSKYEGYLRNMQFVVGGNTLTINQLYASLAASASTTATNLGALPATATIGQLVTGGYLTADKATSLSRGLGMDVTSLTVAQVQTGYTTKAAQYTAASNMDQNKELDCTQTGWGVTPIIGLNYHIGDLNLAARYEFITSMNIQNDTKVNTTGVASYDDGVNTPNDIPALLSLGAEYKFFNKLKLSAGYHHFFDSDAKMANDKQQYINGGINEYLFGAEYNITDRLLVSAGGQVTRTGVTDAYQSDMSFSLNSYSIGFGGAFNITEKLRLNMAYFFTNYSDWTKASANYNNTGLAGTDVFARTNKVFGVGVDYRF